MKMGRAAPLFIRIIGQMERFVDWFSRSTDTLTIYDDVIFHNIFAEGILRHTAARPHTMEVIA
jgi:hypothetical protein